MKNLVTGGAGFIGSHLVEYLSSIGQKVLVLDDFSGPAEQISYKYFKDDLVEVVNGSILDQKLIEELMQSVTKCFHLAASLGVERINNDSLR